VILEVFPDAGQAGQHGDAVLAQVIRRADAGQHEQLPRADREAFRLLETAGLVDIEHGSGVFVHRPAPLIRLGSDRYSRAFRDSGLSPFLLECAKQGKADRFEVLSISRTRPPEHVAGTLAVPADEESVLARENIFWAGSDPVHRVTTYIPWQIAEDTGLLEEDIPHPYGIHGMSHQRTCFPVRTETPQERADACKCTLTSAADVKPNMRSRRADRRKPTRRDPPPRAYCRLAPEPAGPRRIFSAQEVMPGDSFHQP
jgi:UTRA domain